MRIKLLVLIYALPASGIFRRLAMLRNLGTQDNIKCEFGLMTTMKSFDACVVGYEKSGYKAMSEG
jgi:hypothetical protein